MRIQEHIDKISWTFADKGIYVLYGLFVVIFQINYLSPTDYGLFTLLNNLNIWILIISDGFALMSIIQYGSKKENRGKVNLIALIIHIAITLGASLIFYLLKYPIADLFSEPRMVEVASYLPILVFLNIPRTYCMKFIYRDRVFKQLFIIDMLLFGSMIIVTLLLIYINNMLQFQDMIYIYLAGTFLGSLTAVFLTRKNLIFSTKGDISAISIMKFGLPLTLYNTLHSIPRNMDYFVVQYFFSTATVGIYSSAKQLFRFFEEGMMAANSMVYPVAVSQIERKDKKGLSDLMTKSISFMLVSFLLLVIIFEVGLAQIIIDILLPERYSLAIGHFKILILSALALPFLMLGSVITASGKPKIVLIFVFLSIITWLITFVIIGYVGDSALISLAMLVYLLSLGSLCLVYAIKQFDFQTKLLFRAFNDSRNFISSLLEKRKNNR